MVHHWIARCPNGLVVVLAFLVVGCGAEQHATSGPLVVSTPPTGVRATTGPHTLVTVDRRLPRDTKVTQTFSAKDRKVSVPVGTRFRYDFTKDPTATWHVTPEESAAVVLVDAASAGTGHAYELTFDAVERGTAELTFTYTSGLDPTPPGTVPTPFIVIVAVT